MVYTKQHTKLCNSVDPFLRNCVTSHIKNDQKKMTLKGLIQREQSIFSQKQIGAGQKQLSAVCFTKGPLQRDSTVKYIFSFFLNNKPYSVKTDKQTLLKFARSDGILYSSNCWAKFLFHVHYQCLEKNIENQLKIKLTHLMELFQQSISILPSTLIPSVLFFRFF